MKIGDLVKMKNDGGDPGRWEELGLIVELNTDADSSSGLCWQVFYPTYRRALPAWEYELEVIGESD
jgi:hypothetical protein